MHIIKLQSFCGYYVYRVLSTWIEFFAFAIIHVRFHVHIHKHMIFIGAWVGQGSFAETETKQGPVYRKDVLKFPNQVHSVCSEPLTQLPFCWPILIALWGLFDFKGRVVHAIGPNWWFRQVTAACNKQFLSTPIKHST